MTWFLPCSADIILDGLIYDWSYLTTDRDERLKVMAAYRLAEREAAAAGAAIKATLTQEQERLLGRYVDAIIASDALAATSAMRTGGKAALRLLLSLLTA